MNTVEDILSNSTAIYNSTLWQVLHYNDTIINNKLGRYWLASGALLRANSDPRARQGTFTTPWTTASISKHCKMPQLKFITDNLSDLMDARTLEINKIAKEKNKKIIILWSGGIDSTCILVSFLKNLSIDDLKNVSVAMNIESIQENLEFFLKHILNKLNIIDLRKVLISNKFLKNNILIHGDPGDSIHYPATWHFNHMIAQEKHLNNFMDHLDDMAIGINFNSVNVVDKSWPQLDDFCKKNVDDGFGLWYINKIKNNIIECKVDDYITTVSDFWWWHYFNFKWNHLTQSVLFNLRKDFEEPLDSNEIDEYFKCTFYNTETFQHWSWTNLKKLLGKNANKTAKLEARQYIFDYDKNQNYFDTKRKTASGSLGHHSYRLPFIVFDKNYIGYKNSPNGIHYTHILKVLLEKYEG